MTKLKIKQVRSIIKTNANQKATIKALGLGRPNYETIMPDNPQTRGMLVKVRHLVEVQEIK
jgi:large subunit ribosomal protein L30